MSTPSSTVTPRDPWRPTGGEIAAAIVVLLALAALAAFSLWGLNPSPTRRLRRRVRLGPRACSASMS